MRTISGSSTAGPGPGDPGAAARSAPARGLEHVPRPRVDGRGRVVEPGRDAQVAQRRRPRPRQRQAPAGRLQPGGAGQDVERQLEVVDGAGHRPHDAEIGVGERARGRRQMAALRDDAERRLVPAHAAPVGRHADGAADVAAQLERREAGGDRRRGAARRPAGGARGVPRVVGDAEDRIVGLPVAGQRGRVGLAEDHRAGVAQAAHRLGVALGYVVPRLEAACGAHADGLVACP